MLTRLLCWLGFHNYESKETFTKRKCNCCGKKQIWIVGFEKSDWEDV